MGACLGPLTAAILNLAINGRNAVPKGCCSVCLINRGGVCARSSMASGRVADIPTQGAKLHNTWIS